VDIYGNGWVTVGVVVRVLDPGGSAGLTRVGDSGKGEKEEHFLFLIFREVSQTQSNKNDPTTAPHWNTVNSLAISSLQAVTVQLILNAVQNIETSVITISAAGGRSVGRANFS
jgi:hypothetical protein